MSVPVLPHRRDLRQGDLVFPEEILRIGHKLDFQFDCVSEQIQREVFGPELDTGKLGDWLNLYAAYDFALQDVVDHIDITLCRNNGEEEHPFTYPLNRAERDVLRGEMEAACLRQTGRTLAQQYQHLLVREEAEPPELTGGQHRIPVDKVSFTDELSECDGRLLFYVPVAFDPDAVFGTHVATAENDDWLSVYAVYDLDRGEAWPWEDIPEAINNYLGDWDGPLTNEQIDNIADILREYDRDGYKDEESFVARIMSVIDGQKYVCRMIRGCCQGEWNYLVMPEAELENLDYISRTYWGLYDVWEIDNIIVYTYGYTENAICNELAAAIGCAPGEIELEG